MLVSTVNIFQTSIQLFWNDSAIQSVFYTDVQPSSLFSARISNIASTAARTTVSCLYSAHARLPLREPPGLWIGTRLSLEGHLFLKQFLEHLFSHNSHIFNGKWLPIDLFGTLQGTFFEKKCKKWKVCLDCIYVYGLHMSPSPRALSAPQKLRKKATCVKYTLFCIKKTQKYEKIPPKGTHMGEGILVVAPLGAPLALQFVFWDKKCIQKAPKVTPRCLNWAQKWCQSGKSASKIVKI